MRDYLAGHWTLVLLWALEKTLWLFALLGGAPGGWLGMRAFHHKTRHWYFRYGFPLLAALDAALLLWLRLG